MISLSLSHGDKLTNRVTLIRQRNDTKISRLVTVESSKRGHPHISMVGGNETNLLDKNERHGIDTLPYID